MKNSNEYYKFLEPLGVYIEKYMQLEDLEGEVWKPLPDYEKYYHVSSLGRIKFLNRIVIERRKKLIKEHILKPKQNGHNYWAVGIYINNKNSYKYVHRLVAVTFLPNPENKPEIDHLNTNSNDNRLSNLAWVTHMENQYNPITRFKKIQSESLCIPIVQLSIIGDKIADWKSIKEASYFTGISDGSICANINHPDRNISAGGYIFMTKEDYEAGKFKLPLLKSSSYVIEKGIPSELTPVLFLRGELKDVYPSNIIAAKQFGISQSTITTMCKHEISGKYKTNEIKFKFFKDLTPEEQMKVRIMLLNKRKVAG